MGAYFETLGYDLPYSCVAAEIVPAWAAHPWMWEVVELWEVQEVLVVQEVRWRLVELENSHWKN